MSLNTAHANGGVLIHSGEGILLFSDNTTMEFSGQDSHEFKGTKHGRIYLTTHRAIFNAKDRKEMMQSFSFPFITLSDVSLEQPVFGANYIKGKVRAQPNGNWTGEAKFKLAFKHGGAIEFGQALLKAARLASRNATNDLPPPYVSPASTWYDPAPPPAYAPPPQGYYGWLPPTDVFPNRPPPNSVFMSDAPPPYPGINVPPQQGGGFNQPNAGFQQPNAGFQQQPGGFQQQPGGFQQQPGGYPQQPGGYNQQPGGFQPGYSQAGGYPPNAAMGWQTGPMPGQTPGGFTHGDAKAAEAAQSAYYDPNRPQMAYVPPPSYYEHPPSYDQATHKKNE